jgi:hypothetical protein
MLDVLRAEREASGRAGRLDVIAMPLVPFLPSAADYDADRLAAHVAELAGMGVTGVAMGLPASSRQAHVEALGAYGESVLPLLASIP